jgi:Pathogenicity locus
METDLRALPNVGAAVAGMLARVGIERPEDLRGQTAERLYQRLCEADGRRHDPCLRDTLVAVFDYANGAPPHPWWYYSRLRVDARSAARYEALADTPLRPDPPMPRDER